jgi:hypothetical protein
LVPDGHSKRNTGRQSGMTESLRNGPNSSLLPATSNAAEMMSFPLGSLESRAAARSLLIARGTSGDEGTLLRIMITGKPVDPQRKCSCQTPAAGIWAVCKCFL